MVAEPITTYELLAAALLQMLAAVHIASHPAGQSAAKPSRRDADHAAGQRFTPHHPAHAARLLDTLGSTTLPAGTISQPLSASCGHLCSAACRYSYQCRVPPPAHSPMLMAPEAGHLMHHVAWGKAGICWRHPEAAAADVADCAVLCLQRPGPEEGLCKSHEQAVPAGAGPGKSAVPSPSREAGSTCLLACLLKPDSLGPLLWPPVTTIISTCLPACLLCYRWGGGTELTTQTHGLPACRSSTARMCLRHGATALKTSH